MLAHLPTAITDFKAFLNANHSKDPATVVIAAIGAACLSLLYWHLGRGKFHRI